jgi:hypothetical protein
LAASPLSLEYISVCLDTSQSHAVPSLYPQHGAAPRRRPQPPVMALHVSESTRAAPAFTTKSLYSINPPHTRRPSPARPGPDGPSAHSPLGCGRWVHSATARGLGTGGGGWASHCAALCSASRDGGGQTAPCPLRAQPVSECRRPVRAYTAADRGRRRARVRPTWAESHRVGIWWRFEQRGVKAACGGRQAR